MSGWHRENPDLIGTSADPWMIHKSYAAEMGPLRNPQTYAEARAAVDAGFLAPEELAEFDHESQGDDRED